MDDRRVYVPLHDVTIRSGGESRVIPDSATITALDRETGAVRWIRRIVTDVPPIAGGDVLFVASNDRLHALAAASGRPLWDLPLGGRVLGPMLLRGAVLIALTDADGIVGVRTDTRQIAWRQAIGDPKGLLMNADDSAVYAAAADGRVRAVRLADGGVAWERTLDGVLSEPALGKDRVLVGSTTTAMWALDPRSGDIEWWWRPGRIFGGDVIGAAVEDDVVYVVSLDNIVRALNRGNGNQRWRKSVGTRPVMPPSVVFGTVVVVGDSPKLTTFVGRTGAQAGTWAGPANAELQGPPLIDRRLKPYRVAIAVVLRDGRVIGLRPAGMTFPEPQSTPQTALPGRPLPIERLPVEGGSK